MIMETYTRICPECGGRRIFENEQKGEAICKECGLVIEENLADFGQDWSSDDDSRKSRVGPPISFLEPRQGLSSDISFNDIKKLDGAAQYRWKRLRRWQWRTSQSVEVNLRFALSDIKRIASVLKLPRRAEEDAARLYHEVLCRGLVRGRLTERIVAGCIYSVIRSQVVPRTVEDVEIATSLTKKEILRAYTIVNRVTGNKPRTIDPSAFVYRVCSSLDLDAKVVKRTNELIAAAESANLVNGKSPLSIAAAAVYVASIERGTKTTERNIAMICGVTEVTMRKRFSEIVREVFKMNCSDFRLVAKCKKGPKRRD